MIRKDWKKQQQKERQAKSQSSPPTKETKSKSSQGTQRPSASNRERKGSNNVIHGVPQGSILSTKLFNIKINNIVKCLDDKTDCSLYVDDFCICYRSKNIRTVDGKLQQNLTRIEDWATNNGFKFSKSKTQCVHFCHLRKKHDHPDLCLYGSQIPVVEEVKFLGVIFDRKLSFLPHIKYLKAKCLKALNLLKVLAHTSWGADRVTLLNLYRSLIRSKLDYGSVVYGSARKSYLQKLDTIHHQGLRLALGAFQTSPVTSLYVEADEPSLALRREKLALQYAIRHAANPNNPASKTTYPSQFSDLYESKPHAIKPFGLRILPLLEGSKIHPKNIQEHDMATLPSWCVKKPTVLFDLHNGKKSESNPCILKQNFQELQSRFSDYQHIFTDGSKDDDKVGCAYVSKDAQQTLRLPDGSSIFTAEAKAVDLALDYITTCRLKQFVIFSDSLSVLKALNHTSSKNHQIQKIIEKIHEISKSKEIILCWLPSHIGISGNESADRKAKESLSQIPSDFKIPFNNFKPFINKYILSKWQTSWNGAVFNKLHAIEPNISKKSYIPRLSRKEDVVLTRLRIGHTRLTHSYLLQREEQPVCIGCNEPLTVKHILVDCVDFLQTTRNGFKFSKSKTQCVHFCQQRKIHNDPALYIYGSQIPVVAESKFLGVIFDRKLSFIPHIKYVKAKCLKALSLLKVLSHTSWGADRTTLLHLYRSLIRSKLDYGSIVYGSARKSYLQMLDTVHNQGLRLALGAFRTSAISSLNVEADEPSLWLRREKLSLQYAIRLAANPAFEVTFPPQFEEYYERKSNAIKSFGLRIAPL